MRKRNIKKQIWLDVKEDELLKRKLKSYFTISLNSCNYPAMEQQCLSASPWKSSRCVPHSAYPDTGKAVRGWSAPLP